METNFKIYVKYNIYDTKKWLYLNVLKFQI